MIWTKLKVNVNPVAVDAVSNMMFDLGIEGVEIDDQFLSIEDQKAMFVNYVDASLVPLEEYRVIAYLDETQDMNGLRVSIEAELLRLRDFMEVGSGRIDIEVMPEEDYENNWKAYYKPFRVGKNLIVTPIWETPEVLEGDIVIAIDPGMAFGTGTHETTSLCIEYLLEHQGDLGSVLDIGCGSGILGITAVKLGAVSAIGVDIDENAVTIAKENVAHNKVDHQVYIYQGNLIDHVEEPVDLLVANILADVLIMLTKDVKKVLKKDGVFITSGIIEDKEMAVTEALLAAEFKIVDIKRKGEWVAIKATL
jgi:ribosomal protein L11 methyltransferase